MPRRQRQTAAAKVDGDGDDDAGEHEQRFWRDEANALLRRLRVAQRRLREANEAIRDLQAANGGDENENETAAADKVDEGEASASGSE